MPTTPEIFAHIFAYLCYDCAGRLQRALQEAHRIPKDTIFAVYEDIAKDLYGIWKSQMSK